jgi:hypothetical protein
MRQYLIKFEVADNILSLLASIDSVVYRIQHNNAH